MKNPRLIIEAGHTPSRPGALSYKDDLYEHDFTKDLQDRTLYKMNQKRMNTVGLQGSAMQFKQVDEGKNLSNVINLFNTMPSGSRAISIHFNNNNPNATGIEVIIDPRTNEYNKKRASYIVKSISEILDIPVRRRSPGRDWIYPGETFIGKIGIVERTTIPVVLVEVCFLNERDLKKYIGKEDSIATILALGIKHDFVNSDQPEYKEREEMEKLKSRMISKIPNFLYTPPKPFKN